MDIETDRFEELVADALDRIPEDLYRRIQNVAVIVEQQGESGSELLGEYIGTPLSERYEYSGAMPDVIKIYQGPITDQCETEEEVVEEVLITVVHEVAHYFGFEEEELHRLGWG